MRRFWRQLTRRQIWLHSEMLEQPVWIKRTDRWTRPGYWFQARVYRPEWGEWRQVGVFPDPIRNDKGRLIGLRINNDVLGSPGEGSVFYLDDASLMEQS